MKSLVQQSTQQMNLTPQFPESVSGGGGALGGLVLSSGGPKRDALSLHPGMSGAGNGHLGLSSIISMQQHQQIGGGQASPTPLGFMNGGVGGGGGDFASASMRFGGNGMSNVSNEWLQPWGGGNGFAAAGSYNTESHMNHMPTMGGKVNETTV